MKKLFLSLSLIAALTVSTGAMAFAADGEQATTTNENTTTITQVEEAVVDSQDTNTYCQYNGEGCRGAGKGKADGQGFGKMNRQGGAGNKGLGNGEKRGNCDGICDGTGKGMKENCDGTGKGMGLRAGMQK